MNTKLIPILSMALFFALLLPETKAQQSHYSDGVTELVLDQSYAANNNWNQVFSDYQNPPESGHKRDYRKIVVAPDGSIFMTQKTIHELWKFDPTGKKVKVIGKHGSKPGQFPMMPEVQGIIDGKYVYTYDCNGRIKIFTLDGELHKEFSLDYMPLRSAPVKGNKIAFLGHVPWKNGDVKYIISIYDIETGKEKIIWSHMQRYKDMDRNSITINMGKRGMIGFSAPFKHSRYNRQSLVTTKEGNLLVAIPSMGMAKIFSPSGEKLKEFKLELKRTKITEEDKAEFYAKLKDGEKRFEERLKKSNKFTGEEIADYMAQYKKGVERTKQEGYYPAYLPYFSNVMIDDHGNLLVVEFSKEKGSNQFHVYTFDQEGKHMGSSEIKCDKYKIQLSSSFLQFHNNKIIAVALDETDKEIPLRLLRFNLK